MKKYYFFTFILIIQTFLLQSQEIYHPKRIMLKFSEASFSERADLDLNRFNVASLDKINESNNLSKIKVINPSTGSKTFILEFEDEKDIPSIIKEYKATRLFKFVEPDYVGYGGGGVVPSDAAYHKQWGLENDGSFTLSTAIEGADIDMQRAWEITTGSEDVVIAILDTGAKLDHPEFAGRIWTNAEGNRGEDFANDDIDPTDDHGHGTNVMGILAANANNGGFAGVNWNSKLMVLKILNSQNFGYYSWWTEAIYYAADNGAKVVNMSVGGSGFSEIMEEAINYATQKGVIIVACMMNNNNDEVFYPAGYTNTIAVGASNPDDTRTDKFPWGFNNGSNYGSHIDVIAPGNFIFGPSYRSNINTGTYWSGTSQATPHVTGLISLLLSLDSSLDLASVRTILESTSEDQVGKPEEDAEGFDQYHGHGRVNAFEALTLLRTSKVSEVEARGFDFSPNPISQGDPISITFEGKTIRTISVFDASGKLLFKEESNQDHFELTSTKMDRGAYFIKIQEKNKRPSTKKLLIK